MSQTIYSPYYLQCCIVWNMQWNQKHHTVPQAMVPTAKTTFLIYVCSSVVPMKGGKLCFCSPRSQGRQPIPGAPGYVVWNWVASVFGCMCSWSSFNIQIPKSFNFNWGLTSLQDFRLMVTGFVVGAWGQLGWMRSVSVLNFQCHFHLILSMRKLRPVAMKSNSYLAIEATLL